MAGSLTFGKFSNTLIMSDYFLEKRGRHNFFFFCFKYVCAIISQTWKLVSVKEVKLLAQMWVE
jgi:hypothetical protein